MDARVERHEADRATAAIWGAPFVGGLLIAAIGILAIVLAAVATLATVFAFGLLLVVGGIIEMAAAFRRREGHQLLLPLLSGVLSLVVGVLFIARPVTGLAAITLMLAAFFFASGLFRGITSLMDRYARWGLDLLYGVVAIALGVILLAGFPLAPLWVIGTLVGVELLVRGSAIMGMALMVRGEMREHRVATPA